MKKWSMIIDVELCEDCNNCFLTCKEEHVDNDWPGYALPQPRHGHRWMDVMRKERGQYPLIDVAYRPTPCMHCDSAPCIRAAKEGAIYKRDDGIVIIDPQKAKGQKELLKSCPYDAIWWNDEQQIAQKCTFCAHLLDEGWKVPRCVQACPTGALRAVQGSDEEMAKIAQEEKLEALHPEFKTKPRVYYKKLFRFERCFVAGSVAVDKNGVVDCAKGAAVTLRNSAGRVGEAITDNFGDFKVDNLAEKSGKYTLEVRHPIHGSKEIEVEITTSVNVGTLML